MMFNIWIMLPLLLMILAVATDLWFLLLDCYAMVMRRGGSRSDDEYYTLLGVARDASETEIKKVGGSPSKQ